MRIALQPKIPGLIDQLQNLAPGIDAFVLPSTDEPGERIAAGALLGTAAGGTQLPALIERCKGLRWGHILGTGVDKFPLHLIEDKLVTCSRGATAGHWIYQHPRVFLSPHISWSGPNIIDRLTAPFFANVMAFSNDQPMQGVVDTSAGY